MMDRWEKVVAWSKKWLNMTRPNWREQQSDLVDIIDQARQDWLAAQSYFNEVTDPVLIDHSIYAMHATQTRYIYLWQQARQERVRIRGMGTHPEESERGHTSI